MTVLGPLTKTSNSLFPQTKNYHYFIMNIIYSYTICEATKKGKERGKERYFLVLL